VPLSKGVPLKRGHQRGIPSKKTSFSPTLARLVLKRLQIGTHMLHIKTSTGDGLFRFINTDNFKPPKERFLVNFSRFHDFSLQHTLLSVNCTEMAGDRSRQLAYKIFSIKCKFQKSKLRPTRFKEACTGMRQRRHFTGTGSFIVKTIAGRHRHTAYHNKH